MRLDFEEGDARGGVDFEGVRGEGVLADGEEGLMSGGLEVQGEFSVLEERGDGRLTCLGAEKVMLLNLECWASAYVYFPSFGIYTDMGLALGDVLGVEGCCDTK